MLHPSGGADVARRAERAGGVVRRAEALPGAGVRRGDASGRRRALAAVRHAGRLHIAIITLIMPMAAFIDVVTGVLNMPPLSV